MSSSVERCFLCTSVPCITPAARKKDLHIYTGASATLKTWEVLSTIASNFRSLPAYHTFHHFSTVHYIYLKKGHRKETQLSFPYIFTRLFYFSPPLLSLFLWVDFLKTQPCSDITAFLPLYIFSCFGSSSSFL
jgi:hypothetical protein